MQKHPEKQGLSYWRERILVAILSVGLVFALFLFVPMTLMAIEAKLWVIVLLNAVVCGTALMVLIFRGWKYEIRAGCTLLLTFALGAYIIFYFGLFSGGPVCLFAFAVMAGLLLGWRAAVGALIVNAVTLLLFGWLAATGRWGQDMPFFPTPLRATVSLGTYLLMNAMTAISAAVMVRGMHGLAEMERASKEELRAEQGKLTREIEERIRAEKALRESEQAHRLLAENVNDIIWTVDPATMRFTYVSPSVYRMRGFTPEEAMTQSVEETLSPESFERVIKALAEELARDGGDGVDPKRSKTFEIQQKNKDGSSSWVEATMTFIRDDVGRPVGILGVSRDVHKRKLAEEEKARLEKRLQEAQRMEAIASLAGGIAHQFNNALSVILGRIDMLELEPRRDRELEIEPIKQSAERMVHLTNQLLAYARGGRYQARVVPAENLVNQTLALIGHLIPPTIRVEADIQAGTSAVKADETQFQMAFSAVVFNAVEAIEGKGRIRISCRNETVTSEEALQLPDLEAGPYVLLCVEDDGKGMDKEARSRIFEPFFTTKFQGRGLGMAAAYGVIRNHDGWITVDSEPGRGTTVRMHLPVSKKAAEAAPKDRPATGQRTGTVLVVEDEDMVMDVSRAMLEKLGYRVLPARTGEEAVRLGSGHDGTIDLVLLDLKLPDMDAKQVYTELVAVRPGLKVIVCSGYTLEGPAQEVLNAGADGFLQKPFSLEALSGKIDEIH